MKGIKAMIYNDVISRGWHLILPKKQKYTARDVKKIIEISSSNPKLNGGRPFDWKPARFITICTAIFHDAEYSKRLETTE